MQVNSESGSGSPKTAQLKAQIALELRNKQRCAYSSYKCSQLSLPKSEYCIHHILSDKNAPYKCCSFVYPSGKRCHLAALKSNKRESVYCHEHALKTHLSSTRSSSKVQPGPTAESMLFSLSHHVKFHKSRVANVPSNEDVLRFSEEAIARNVDPFALDVKKVLSANDMLEMHSDSDSEYESSNFSSAWADADAESSNDESNDAELNDPQKHSDVFSPEQVTLVARDKLVQLQTLYIDQYKQLAHVLKEKKRRYYHALKREKETCCSIYNQNRDNPKEQELYKKLKAHNHFHRKRGVEAILRKKLIDQRVKITDGVSGRPQSFYTKCAFSEGGVKCIERALPVARHCRKHILEDPNQVLFRECGKRNADISCLAPVEAIFEDLHCILHRDVPTLKIYSQLRKDSESDHDDLPMDGYSKIKTEVDTDCSLNSPGNFYNHSSSDVPMHNDNI